MTKLEYLIQTELKKPVKKTRTALQLERIQRAAAQIDRENKTPTREEAAQTLGVLETLNAKLTKSKYGAVRTTIDGIAFDSKAEANRFTTLKKLALAGEIYDLELQPKYPLHTVCGEAVGHYIADFRYRLSSTGVLVVEDVKGVRTPLYKWKKKHFELQYRIKILEVTK